MEVRALNQEDYQAVKFIYEDGIATGNATFETHAPDWQAWDAAHLEHSRLVAILHQRIVGWAALSPVSGRCVYAGVAETSVYIHPSYKGQNIGYVLLERLTAESEAQGIWTLQAGIFRENKASIRLHEKAGFRLVGYRERIGALHGQWRDVMLFEKRSKRIGTD